MPPARWPEADVSASWFVEDGGEILVAKLVSTLLGALWITVAAGWITIVQTLAEIEIQILNRAAAAYVAIIRAVGVGGARTIEATWAGAAAASIEASPVLAPVIFSAVVVVTFAILVAARRRWVS